MNNMEYRVLPQDKDFEVQAFNPNAPGTVYYHHVGYCTNEDGAEFVCSRLSGATTHGELKAAYALVDSTRDDDYPNLSEPRMILHDIISVARECREPVIEFTAFVLFVIAILTAIFLLLVMVVIFTAAPVNSIVAGGLIFSACVVKIFVSSVIKKGQER